MWIAMANIVALFDIRKAVDAADNEITPPTKFLPGFTRSVLAVKMNDSSHF